MKILSAIVLLLILNSCQEKPNFYGIDECYNYFHVNEQTKKYSLENTEIKIPKNWSHEHEYHNEDSVNKFYSPVDTNKITTISEQEFNSRYNNFSILVLTEGILDSQESDYDSEISKILNTFKSDQKIKYIEEGVSNYEDYPIKWVKYLDDSFGEDGFKGLGFTTLIIKDGKYVWIMGQIFGDELVDTRMCHLLQVIKTIKLKN